MHGGTDNKPRSSAIVFKKFVSRVTTALSIYIDRLIWGVVSRCQRDSCLCRSDPPRGCQPPRFKLHAPRSTLHARHNKTGTWARSTRHNAPWETCLCVTCSSLLFQQPHRLTVPAACPCKDDSSSSPST